MFYVVQSTPLQLYIPAEVVGMGGDVVSVVGVIIGVIISSAVKFVIFSDILLIKSLLFSKMVPSNDWRTMQITLPLLAGDCIFNSLQT